MCYDVSFTVNVRELSDYFPELRFENQMTIDFGMLDHVQGVSVFGDFPIIFEDKDESILNCQLASWGIIEHYLAEVPGIEKRNGMLNIRAERILDDPKSYWYKIRTRRCLIPVTGIFEHREVVGWTKKVPYWVRPCDQEITFLPGLRAVANIVDKETGELKKMQTFGMITRTANSLMRNIHNSVKNGFRMPLFLPFNMAQEFVSNKLTDLRYREILNYQIPSEELSYHPTWTIRSSKLRKDNKQKHEPFEWENLPELGEMNPV